MHTQLGKDIPRKEAWSKVSGAAEYSADEISHTLFAKLLTSTCAHGKIISLKTEKAAAMDGVKSVITAKDADFLCGTLIRDRPPLAKDKVRYFGEPVAIVVADSEERAKAAVSKIEIVYEKLPIVSSIDEAVKPNGVLVHEDNKYYERMVEDVYPIVGTNICHLTKIRKGSMADGWKQSDITVESTFNLPQSDHAAMETRFASCKIYPDGRVLIKSSSQAPFSVKEEVSEYFKLKEGDIVVKTPFVGGGFGGKAAVFLEVLALMAAKTVPGKTVRLAISREEDIATAPCRIGLKAVLKLGFMKNGKICAAQMTYYADCGAYAEIGPRMAQAISVDSAGPYNIENIHVDAYGVYTNRTFVTSFRGFGHISSTFCLERIMDKASSILNIDSFEIRRINLAKEGDFNPTLTKITLSNTGNINECLTRLKTLINWEEGARIEESGNLIRAKGIALFSKTSDSKTDSRSSVIIDFNKDASVNLNCGAVEIGPGMKTAMAQILAEKLRMDIDRIFVQMEVDTRTTPKHWKTVASMTTILAGRAVLAAAEDVINQLLKLGAIALRCPAEDLDFGNEMVFVKADPSFFVEFKDLVNGYKYPNGNSIMGPIIGRGSYVMNRLTVLDKETGKGKAGLSWTVGAQAVEIEYDKIQHTFRFLKGATVIDAGKVLNPKTAKGVVMGGMCMGLGLSSGEKFTYDSQGILQNTSFRTYKMLRYGETPDYLIEFVETPQIDTPFGARGIAEHGIIGIPAAFANALSLAAGVEIDELGVSPEDIWRKKTGGRL